MCHQGGQAHLHLALLGLHAAVDAGCLGGHGCSLRLQPACVPCAYIQSVMPFCADNAHLSTREPAVRCSVTSACKACVLARISCLKLASCRQRRELLANRQGIHKSAHLPLLLQQLHAQCSLRHTSTANGSCGLCQVCTAVPPHCARHTPCCWWMLPAVCPRAGALLVLLPALLVWHAALPLQQAGNVKACCACCHQESACHAF